MGYRVLYHPVLLLPKSRRIFFWFMMAAIICGGLIWWKTNMVMRAAGVDYNSLMHSEAVMESLLVSVPFRLAVILFLGLLAGALTAQRVVGPIGRIHVWLRNWELGRKIEPFRSRDSGKFNILIDLLNKLLHKNR